MDPTVTGSISDTREVTTSAVGYEVRMVVRDDIMRVGIPSTRSAGAYEQDPFLVLQQRFLVTEYKGGAPVRQYDEWRDVPVVEETTAG